MSFLKYFVLEFVIIAIVSVLGYWAVGTPVDVLQIALSSAAAAGVLAYALVRYAKKCE